MDRSTALLSMLVMIAPVCLAGPAAKPAGKANVVETRPKDAKAPDANAPEAKPAAVEAKPKTEAEVFYDSAVDKYMHAKWVPLEECLKDQAKHVRELTAEQKTDLLYIRRMAKEHRPPWWKYTTSSKNITFSANIWGKSFKANYMPSAMLGIQAAVGIDRGVLVVIVSWRPNLVDNPTAAGGDLAEMHKLTKGDLAEAIVWHELGHNYISRFLPLQQVMALYNGYGMLFQALQEFYADMTAMYHCSPPGRKATMMIRLSGMRMNREVDSHTRAGMAIGSFILSNVLAEPSKWPSFHLPGQVPETDIERETIVYVYSHLDPTYSLEEDRNLRTLIGKYLTTCGASILRQKGTLILPNKLQYKLMPVEDRDHQPKRDAWIKEQLQKAIAAGQADKPLSEKEKKKASMFQVDLEIPW